MKHNLYTIFDAASGLYSQPTAEISDETAKRSFGNLAANAETSVGAHPKDYTLIRVGTFNDVTGELKDEFNESLISALESVASSRNVNRDNLQAFDQNINKGNSHEESTQL